MAQVDWLTNGISTTGTIHRLGNTRSAKAENNIVDIGETDTVDVADKSDNP